MRNYDREILDERTLQLAAEILRKRALDLAQQHDLRVTVSLTLHSEDALPEYRVHIHDLPFGSGRGLNLDQAVRSAEFQSENRRAKQCDY